MAFLALHLPLSVRQPGWRSEEVSQLAQQLWSASGAPGAAEGLFQGQPHTAAQCIRGAAEDNDRAVSSGRSGTCCRAPAGALSVGRSCVTVQVAAPPAAGRYRSALNLIDKIKLFCVLSIGGKPFLGHVKWG